uniref:DEK-C domain-containing protein n=1 Tax=Kalanchoe fedtschenkoi TaxID=63787 RepID=A0A7N0UUM1_KALFE
MDDESKQKISDTVMSILKEADMNVMTEFKVRKQASDILSIDLSQPEPKKFIRNLIQSYLDSRAADVQETPEEEEEQEPALEETKPLSESEDGEEDDHKSKKAGSKEYDDDGDLIVCRLSDKRRVTIQDFRGKTLVSIREYYTKDGKELPSSKGISLTAEQWSVFKQNAPAIEQAIRKMESQ